MGNQLLINADAFTSGQISSKLWLCNELEKLNFTEPQIIWIYGGWYGILSLLLFSRQNIPIKHIRSFDIDPTCEPIADALLENWVWQQWKFKAITADCNYMSFENEKPDIIINCSTEHFEDHKWYYSIPNDVLVVLQSNDMIHDDHCSCVSSVNQMKEIFNLGSINYQGQLDFVYPTWKFSRFMLIGKKQ